jgi:DNA-binding transcriptional regulator YhcF (GntR family)
MQPIDPDSPVPIYHQIAQAIRARILAGELRPGDALTPLREAADAWGVNLHTVRHAYTALARDGLVESRGPRGTHVSAAARPKRGSKPDLRAFLDDVRAHARRRFGLSRRELAAAVADASSARDEDRAYVVECSEWQCACHVREIEARWNVGASPWPLTLEDEPPDGAVIATYFHYNDIRRRWPQRLRSVHFVTIAPDPAIADSIPAPAGRARRRRVVVCEKDAATAENVAADLSLVLASRRFRVETLVTRQPRRAVRETDESTIVLYSPRVWAELDEETRRHRRAREARYRFDPDGLNQLAQELGWAPRVTRRERVRADAAPAR